MYLTALNELNQNYPISNIDFKAKKIITKAIKPDKVLDAMTLMSGVVVATGISTTKTSKYDNTSETNQMTNDEFRAMKTEIAKKLKTYNIDINKFKITKNNILVISKLLEHPKFAHEKYIEKYREIKYAESCINKEMQDAKVKFLEVTNQDDELFELEKTSRFLYNNIKTPQDTEIFMQLYNYVINNETLHDYFKENNDLREDRNNKYSFYALYNQIKGNIQILPRIMEDENLRDNFQIIIQSPYTGDKNYEQLLDTFSKKKELLQNENVIYRLSYNNNISLANLDAISLNKILNIEDENIINNILKIVNKYDASNEEFASKLLNYYSFLKALLNTKELYKNKDISENLEAILDIKPKSQLLRNDRVAIIQKIDSSAKLINNQELMNNIGKILASINTHDDFKQIMDTLNTIDNA